MFLKVGESKLYYEVAGAGFPVVLLHGWGANSVTMRPVLKFLAQSVGTRAHALDFPGFGLSDPPAIPWQVSDFAAVVLHFLDTLRLDSVDIVGHSFGGRVAIKLAATEPHRVKRLVLVDSAGIRPKRSAGYYGRVYAAKTVKMVTSALPPAARQAARAKIAQKLGSSDYRQAGMLRQTLVRVVNEDLAPLLPAISCPTLLVWGEKDRETPPADGIRMKQLIPDARLVVIPGAGHFSYLEDQAVFNQHLQSFLGANGD